MVIRAMAVPLILSLSAPMPESTGCDMAVAFAQPDQAGNTTTAVWQDVDRSALLFADTMNVNTDGTRRSYSVSDFWGEALEGGAINNLCNAMSDGCSGLATEAEKRGRRLLTQEARAKGWPADLVRASKISSSIIPFKNGKPCPEVDGFLVSATALHKVRVTDPCDIQNYVDALTVSAIVLPKRAVKTQPTPFQARGTDIGDLAVVLSGDGKVVKYAVVGDSGPSNELGEISVALAGSLLGKTAPPVNYREIRGKSPFQGKGWTVGKTYTLVFPKTKNVDDPFLTQDRIDAAAKIAFDRWGGLGRLRACAQIYKRR